MPLQVLIFILLFGLLQGLLIFFILVSRKNVGPFHVFLSAYIIALLFQIVFKVMSKTWLMDVWPPVYSLSYYLPFLYGPLVYFVTKAAVGKYTFHRKDLVHFAPFLFFALFIAFEEALNFPNAIWLLFTPGIRLLLQLVSLLFYHIAAKNITGDFKQSTPHVPAPLHISFVEKLIRTSLVVACLISFALCFMYVTFPYYQNVKWSFVLLTFFIYSVSLVVFKKPGSFEVVFGKLDANAPLSLVKPILTVLPPEVKYINSGLKDDQANDIIKALQEVMEKKQLFLDTTLTIDKLAELLSCQKHHLSQVLNDKLGVSFNEYMNLKRTEISKQLLSDPDKNNFTIASIAYDSGFNSLSTFNDVFKKITGLTPSQYRKTNLNESQQQRI